MGLFSGIMVNTTGNNGYELSLEDVRIEFNQAFEVLNTEAANFESFCGAIERLEMLNESIQKNDGKADKCLVTFLNHNNSLADALGISIDMESFDEVVVGAELSAACEGVIGDAWEAIKNFFKNIWEGLVNFWESFKNMFRNTKQNLTQVANDPQTDEKIKQAAANDAKNSTGDSADKNGNTKKSEQSKSIDPKISNNNTTAVIKQSALITKCNALQGLVDQISQLQGSDFNSFIQKYKSLHLDEFAKELHLTRKGLEWEFTGSMFGPDDLSMNHKSVAANLIDGGYTQESIMGLVKTCSILETLESGAKVHANALKQIVDMPKEKFPENANVSEAKGAAKLGIVAAKLAGTIASTLHNISKDLLNITSQNFKFNEPENQSDQSSRIGSPASLPNS